MGTVRPTLCVLAVGLAGLTASAQEDKVAVAEGVALEWLAMVDEGDYGGSWDEGARMFKGQVSRSRWQDAARGARGPQGALDSRSLRSRQYETELPGAPDGEYVVVQYDSSFANNRSAIETVSLVLDGDRGWRVTGYFIR